MENENDSLMGFTINPESSVEIKQKEKRRKKRRASKEFSMTDEVFTIMKEKGYEIPSYSGDLSSFFQRNHQDKIYIFAWKTELYLVVQRRWERIEEKAQLTWNEVDDFGNLTERTDVMIDKIKNNHEVYSFCNLFLTDFALYCIPFYFIPIVKETYVPCQFGENKGDWEIAIHKNVELRENPLPFRLHNTKFTLRDYQEVAVSEWHKNGDFGTLSIATAGGKTIIAIQCLYDLKLTTLIAVPTTTLVYQWKEEIMKFLPIDSDQIGFFFGRKKELKPILIGTYNSILKYIHFSDAEKEEIQDNKKLSHQKKKERIKKRQKISNFLQNYYSFLIFDESHHIPAPTFRYIALRSKALKRLSLSATVERYDKNETLLYFSCGEKVFKLDYIDLCEQKHVVPFVYQLIECPLSQSILKQYKDLGMDLDGKKRMTYFTDAKLYNLIKILKTHVRKGHQILVFVSYIDHIKEIYTTMNSLGIKTDIIVSTLHQRKISKYKRNEVISRFKNKEINVVLSTTVLDEGFNVPNCSVAVIVSGSSADRQLIQRIGRIVRKGDDGTKIGYVYEIVSVGDGKIIPIDQTNHLVRNLKIESKKQYKKEQELLPENCWIFNYSQITQYAKEKAKRWGIEIINPFD